METGRSARRLLTWSAPDSTDTGPPVLDDFNGPPEVFPGPGLDALVMGVGPHQRDPGEQEVEAGQQEHAALLVMDVRRVELDLEKVALGVDQRLPPVTFLPPS